MNLLLDGVDVIDVTRTPAEVDVSGVEYDSRRVGPGVLFCCLPGQVDDGHRHAPEAVARGAVALLAERRLSEGPPASVPQVIVRPGDARPAMAKVAAAFYGHPAEQLLTAGVTGTNGKTTVSHILAAVLEAAGHPCRVIGTLSGTRTTPESPDLQRLLAEVRDQVPAGRQGAVSMEVSSHAVVQARVDGFRFDVVAFTNLSHEHLDYHGTMEAYFEAKASLFTSERARRAVVNVDDPWGRRLLERLEIDAVAVGMRDAEDICLEPGRTSFSWHGQRVELQLTGLVNVANALMAAECGRALGLGPEEVARGLGSAAPVPGRLEVVATAGADGPATVVVDYAHTPAALEAVLEEARRLRGADGRVVVVFGCGGERDRAKRPQMGAIAARLADVVVVTSDNPRSEDPGTIASEVVAGIERPSEAASSGRLVVELDRRRAIHGAVGSARPGDVVLIGGKGHEAYQEAAGVRREFDDRLVARQAVTERWGG